MPFPRASKALTRFTVLDLTRVRAGPTCARQLADWGANVIKVEAPADGEEPMGGPREGSDFQNLHRNKRSITLDLKTPAGLAAFKRLAKKADVLIENFRPNVKKRLGIDYKTLSRINPRLVYASISGFGQDGPYADRPGFDQIAQGMGGLMSITGLPGQGPVRVGIPVADLCAGLFAALGILVALLERDKSGKGQAVETSLLQAQIFMLDFQASRFLVEGEVARQAGNNHPTTVPTGVFKTRDGSSTSPRPAAEMWSGLRDARRRGVDQKSGLPDRAGALEEPRRTQRRDRRLSARPHQRRMGRAFQQCRRAVRTDLFDRPGVRRSAGTPPRHRAKRRRQGQARVTSRRPAGVAVAHTVTAEGAAAGARPAHRRRAQGVGFSAREIAALQRRKRSNEFVAQIVAQVVAQVVAYDGVKEGLWTNDADRQDALAQGSGRRHRDLQQSRAAQRRIARNVGGHQGDSRDIRRRRRGARRRVDRRRRQGVRVGSRHLQVRKRAGVNRGNARL